LAYRALEKTATEIDRDRILHDIATAFYYLGVRSAARDAYLVLAATAQEQYIRWLATVQLLGISADDRISPIFERYRRELGDSDLPPALAVDFQHQTGRGYRLFGDRQTATVWLQRALATAQRFQLNQESFAIEAEIERLLRDEREEARVEERSAPDTIGDIAVALRELREKATVGID